MNENELFIFYEKLYFHEQQRKEQIFSRLNVPLAVMVALAGFYAVIIATDYKKLDGYAAGAFGLLSVLSVGMLLFGAYFFIDALLGKMDKALATPNSLERWRRELQAYYAGEPDADQRVANSVREAIYNDYMNCASLTAVNNDRKSSSLYYCNMALIFATATALVAYALAKFLTP